MDITSPTRIEIYNNYINSVKSSNAKISTNYSGTLVDIFSLAYSDIVSSVYDYVYTINQGNSIYSASEYMLDIYTRELNILSRKSGSLSSGNLTIVLKPSETSLNIPKNTEFKLGSNVYLSLEETIIDVNNNKVFIQSVNIGVEYNVNAGVVFFTEINAILTATSDGIVGGNGEETLSELRQRILNNIKFRRTSSQLSDYVQYCLEIFNYAVCSTVFVNTVIPVGVDCNVVNTVGDYAIAAKNTVINEIAASPSQLSDLLIFLDNKKTSDIKVYTSTTSTQIIPSLTLNYTSNTVLTADQITEIKESIRVSIMTYVGSTLYAANIKVDLSKYLTSYFFTDFTPIIVTSPMLDILLTNITLTSI